jgi:hypothetical protein
MMVRCANNFTNIFNWGLYGACQGGHEDLAKLMITNCARKVNLGLHGACEGGHENLVELMIANGAYKFHYGLYSACVKGYKNLAELMIIKGAKVPRGWSMCHQNVYQLEHLELMMIEGSRDLFDDDVDNCFDDDDDDDYDFEHAVYCWTLRCSLRIT